MVTARCSPKWDRSLERDTAETQSIIHLVDSPEPEPADLAEAVTDNAFREDAQSILPAAQIASCPDLGTRAFRLQQS